MLCHDDYQLEHQLGEGAMGIVFRARRRRAQRAVAVKLAKRDDHARATTWLDREGAALALFDHPHIVRLVDRGQDRAGRPYLALELIDGDSLEAIVRRGGPLPPARVISILAQIADALAVVHDAGLVHRDVKPANIIVARDAHHRDFARLIDFGLAVPAANHSREAGAANTNANLLVGTPQYLAPERILGHGDTDPRGDLYALGAVGHFALSGRPLFEGTVVDVCRHHLHTPPPPLDAVTPPLAALLHRCLAKTPADRPSDARQLAAALRAL